jgi:hypothetical protein
MKAFIKIIFIAIIGGLFYVGVYYMIKDEEDSYPVYKLTDNNGHYFRTDAYTKDSTGCVHFMNFERKVFRSEIRKREVTLCGNYTITKIK